MADIKKKVPASIPGDFFVDTTCINCDTCRQLCPSVFDDDGDYSFVLKQPQKEQERRSATRALLACPTGSIGNKGENQATEVMEDFPLLIEDSVYYTGFNSPLSFGGNSFFIKEREGNWLIDSPKFNNHLINWFEQQGGIKYIFLTHEDDVAEAEKYADHFLAKRIIHKHSLEAEPDSEIVIEDFSSLEFLTDIRIIPTPGHTKGHMVLIYKDKFLFSGDHLYVSRKTGELAAHRKHCWYSWKEQTNSMKKLMDYQFEWILAGHGDRGRFEKDAVKKQLEKLIENMAS